MQVNASRTLTVAPDKGGALTLAELKELVALAEAQKYADDAVVMIAHNGGKLLSAAVKEGE